MKKEVILILFLWLLSGCSYNPFLSNNRTTGSAIGTGVGAAAGAGTIAALGGSRAGIALGAIGGGVIGYYVTTLRFDSGGVMLYGGQVYQVGDRVGIYIPSDQLFEPNTAEFLPQAESILDSAASVLKRYPDNNILISGNTSGFGRNKWERRLSEERAKRVSAYMWNAGINQFKSQDISMRQLTYVGYGDYFPIATDLTNEGIRENSRIQITSYPDDCALEIDKKKLVMQNVGAYES